jgi:hypothetical protein
MAERNLQEGDWKDRERWKTMEPEGIEGCYKPDDDDEFYKL